MTITEADVQSAKQALRSGGKSAHGVGAQWLSKRIGCDGGKSEAILKTLRSGEAISDPVVPDLSCDELLNRYRDYIGWRKPVKSRERTPKSDGWKKIVIINDPHSPYQAKEAIQEMAARERHDADLLVVNGDLSDLQNWSRHDKFSQRYTPVDEITETQGLLNFLSESFPEVVLIPGNHDERWLKYLVRQGIAPEILDAFRVLCPDFGSPLNLYAKGLSNVRIAPARQLGPAEFGWFYQLGDLICTHAEVYSKIANRAVGNVIHWLKSYAEPQGIVEPFKVVVQGHTHQAGMTWNDFGVWGIENGCMCLVGDYCGSPQLRGAPRPWMKGYTVAWQKDGVTDIDRLRFVPLGF